MEKERKQPQKQLREMQRWVLLPMVPDCHAISAFVASQGQIQSKNLQPDTKLKFSPFYFGSSDPL